MVEDRQSRLLRELKITVALTDCSGHIFLSEFILKMCCAATLIGRGSKEDVSVAKSAEAFRTISEAADELGVPQHVLRHWEDVFGHIRPMRRAGGRRYYRPIDIDLLRGVRVLLYDERYTTKGVQKIFIENGVKYVTDLGQRALAGERVNVRADLETSVEGATNGTGVPANQIKQSEALNANTQHGRDSLIHKTGMELERLIERLEGVKSRLDEALDTLDTLEADKSDQGQK